MRDIVPTSDILEVVTCINPPVQHLSVNILDAILVNLPTISVQQKVNVVSSNANVT